MLPAEIVATLATSLLVSTLRELLKIDLATSLLAYSIPSRISTGLHPLSTALIPLLIILRARIVAVVVPSPATSLVLFATSYTNLAPIFSNLSSNSISLAILTPSLVINGEP